MTEEYAAARYDEACALLPMRLRAAALAVDRRRKAEAEELRLRVERPLQLTLPEGEEALAGTRVIRSDMEQVLDRATEFSRYAAAETMRHGYITAEGGFRVGICGTALPQAEKNEGLRDVSSLAIRIPRVREGVARPSLPDLVEGGSPLSTLILSPPGGGKTTFLRDLVRLVSRGSRLAPPCRVSLVDERGELAAVHRGRPQLDVGDHTARSSPWTRWPCRRTWMRCVPPPAAAWPSSPPFTLPPSRTCRAGVWDAPSWSAASSGGQS